MQHKLEQNHIKETKNKLQSTEVKIGKFSFTEVFTCDDEVEMLHCGTFTAHVLSANVL